jgi:hypothetical protein
MPLTQSRPLPARLRDAARAPSGALILGLEFGLLGGLLLALAGPASIALGLAAPLLLLGLARHGRTRRRAAPSAPARPTGLGDAAAFQAGLAAALAAAGHERPPAVILLELDGFVAVRDTLGEPEGDTLLRQAAERLAATARADDLVAHLGGSRFAMLQRAGTQPEAAARVGGRLGGGI